MLRGLAMPVDARHMADDERAAAEAELDRVSPGWRDRVRANVAAAPPLGDQQRRQIESLLRAKSGDTRGR